MTYTIYESLGRVYGQQEYKCNRCRFDNVSVYTKVVATSGSLSVQHAEIKQSTEIQEIENKITLKKQCVNCGHVSGKNPSLLRRLFSSYVPQKEISLSRKTYVLGMSEYSKDDIQKYWMYLLEK